MSRRGIVVVSFGSSELVEHNLAVSARPDDIVVVVDNFSSHSERDRVRALAEKSGWVPVLLETNTGFGHAANVGIDEAFKRGAAVVLLLNPDARIDAGSLDLLERTVLADPLTLASPRVVTPDGRPWMSGIMSLDMRTGRMRSAPERASDPDPEWALPWVSGACMMVSRTLWLRTGGFDEAYFLYWEDVDLCARARAVGGHIAVVREAEAVHDEGATHGDRESGRAKSGTYYYYNIRNRAIFARRWIGARRRLAWHARTLGSARDVVLQGGRRQLLTSRPWGPLLRGLLDGAREKIGPDARAAATFRVLQSFAEPRPTTNPYIVMLGESLEAAPGVVLLRFSWKRALLGGYDAIHFHWPEALFAARSPVRTWGKRAVFIALVARLRLQRTPVVRTVHNVELPRDVTAVERWVLEQVEALTTVRVVLNSAETDQAPGTPTYEILHGHYVGWFGDVAAREPVRGRIAFVGLVRRYKGVEVLLDAFASTRDEAPHLQLSISGKPSSDDLASLVTSAAREDPRISAHLKFLSDSEFVEAMTRAELVVLPYTFMHNSGAALAALSLARPVLVPDNPVNRRLAAEVGGAWVMTYTGTLTGDDLLRAVRAAQERDPDARPDLSRRDWGQVGRQHYDVYAAAARLRRQRVAS